MSSDVSPSTGPPAASSVGRREDERLAALHRYSILDTPDEEPFNGLAMLARDLFKAPIALVSFVDERRQWFKARVGLEAQQTPREWAFCTHAIQGDADEVFLVRDAASDPRFVDNPLVTGAPFIRFYAAVPLRTPDGFQLGTVCVISDKPRPEGISEEEGRWLATLARLASDELELRLQARRAQEAAEAEARLRRAQEAAGVVAFEANGRAADTDRLLHTLRRLLGLEDSAPLNLRGLAALADPGERPHLEAVARRLVADGGKLAEEFRATLFSGEAIWLQIRGEVHWEVAEEGDRWRVAGLLRDVTERRHADERQELMTRELDHRAKNALAVVLAALRLTPVDEPRAYAAAVEGRVSALARAHTLLTETRWAGADLRDLVCGELKPFLAPAGAKEGPRAQVVGPRVMLAPKAAQPLSMALHELATNAIKHGALSTKTGLVQVTWTYDEAMLRLRWAEHGGPAIAAPPTRLGFGSRVMRGTVVDQLGGALDWAWPSSGLITEIGLPTARVLADPAAAASRRE
ncbi:sensor histidine kinase [Falsiroseomonas oryzae]|uniref:sensor histidine kinase n=1 Tax=Falsiroseomonas oryzae TaxID=2766473 RepID=UPI0022EB3C17|nr:HWE histidine kinase domain-containing protein [Roseomonas sp. MO-31]